LVDAARNKTLVGSLADAKGQPLALHPKTVEQLMALPTQRLEKAALAYQEMAAMARREDNYELTKLVGCEAGHVVIAGAAHITPILKKAIKTMRGGEKYFPTLVLPGLAECAKKGVFADEERLSLVMEAVENVRDPETVGNLFYSAASILTNAPISEFEAARDIARSDFVDSDERLKDVFKVAKMWPPPRMKPLKQVSFSTPREALEEQVSRLDDFFQKTWYRSGYGMASTMGYATDLSKSHVGRMPTCGGPGNRDESVIATHPARVESEFWRPLQALLGGFGGAGSGFRDFFSQFRGILYEFGDEKTGFWDRKHMEATVSHTRALKLLDDTVAALSGKGVKNAGVFRDRVAEATRDFFSTVGWRGWLGPGYVYGPQATGTMDDFFCTHWRVHDPNERPPFSQLYRVVEEAGMWTNIEKVSEVDIPLYDWMLLRDKKDVVNQYSPELDPYKFFGQSMKTRTPREYTLTPDREAYDTAYRLLTEKNPMTDKSTFWDVGCGPGYFLEHLRGKGFNGEAAGFDSSPDMVAAARTRGFQAEQVDITKSFPRGSCSHGLCLDVLQNYPRSEQTGFFKSLPQAIEPGGVFVVGVKFGEGDNKAKIEGELRGAIDRANELQYNRRPKLKILRDEHASNRLFLLLGREELQRFSQEDVNLSDIIGDL